MGILPEKDLQSWGLLIKFNWSKVYVHPKMSLYSFFFLPSSSLWEARVLQLESEVHLVALDLKLLFWTEIFNHAELWGWLLLCTNIWYEIFWGQHISLVNPYKQFESRFPEVKRFKCKNPLGHWDWNKWQLKHF